tara:strand:+ start:83266 stop:84807 length:1542 start_codon:yes stop_codon:yes gene_type:complete
MKKSLILNGIDLTPQQVFDVAVAKADEYTVSIAPESLVKMKASREFVFQIVEKGDPVYGINTGFGALSNKHIEKKDLEQLQLNLIRSHCTGVGSPFSREVTRAIMILRANCLTSGYSGVNIEAVQLIIDFINNDIIPVVPEKGSVGASGDLAPLSHIALALIGEGDVVYQGKTVRSDFAIHQIGKKPIRLGPKDGLALINGTAVMGALGCLGIVYATNLMKLADVSAAMTLDGVKGTIKAFDKKISLLKPHPGQISVSKNIATLLKDSEIEDSHEDCGKVQDPYSLRCVPQVHGACRQTLSHVYKIIQTEINSVTDNPLIFVEEQEVISGGNFHGEGIALAMDYLAMGLSEICNICERRIEKMMNPTFSDLPAFLVKESGLNSGLMIAHVTAAALVSENKVLCHPASVDSVPTSTDKEDHVSMGVTSGRKLLEIVENTANVLAIELLCNTQAFEFQRPLKSSPALEAAHLLIRKHVPIITEDRVFATDINNIRALIKNNEILSTVESITGDLF